LEEKDMAASPKPLDQVIQHRRATIDFAPTAVHDEDLKHILEAGRNAPSGYNLQPWRFVIVRDAAQRKALRGAAFGQPKVEDAPVVIVAVAALKAWQQGDLDKVLELSAKHGYTQEQIEGVRTGVTGALSGQPGDICGWGPDWAVWGNRQVMIAFTHMMLMAETLGYDTAPMEGFLESQVKQVLGIPADNSQYLVVAMLAVGHKKGDHKKFGGRFPLDYITYENSWGKTLKI
jgi:nitroreductase